MVDQPLFMLTAQEFIGYVVFVIILFLYEVIEGIKMKQQKQNQMAVNSAEAAENPLLNEPLTFGLILRGLPREIQELKDFLDQSSLVIIYKATSYGHLYIVSHKEGSNGKI